MMMQTVYYQLHRGGSVTPTDLNPNDNRPLRDQGILVGFVPAGHTVVSASYQIDGDRLILETEKAVKKTAKKDPEE